MDQKEERRLLAFMTAQAGIAAIKEKLAVLVKQTAQNFAPSQHNPNLYNAGNLFEKIAEEAAQAAVLLKKLHYDSLRD